MGEMIVILAALPMFAVLIVIGWIGLMLEPAIPPLVDVSTVSRSTSKEEGNG